MTATRRYPIGIQTFSEIIRGGYLYADKTDLVWQYPDGRRVVMAGIRFNMETRTLEDWVIS